jgi:peptide/nickel transport system substrate-binding protein
VAVLEASGSETHRRARRIPAVIALLAAGALQPGGAVPAEPPLVVALSRPILTLDGHMDNARENDILGLLIDEALFAVDAVTGAVVPLAARSHRFADDVTLDVELRDDVRFHDGRLLDAQDVVYTYHFLLDPATRNRYVARFAAWLASVEALGPRSVRFRMKQPYSMALYDLAMYSKLRKAGTYDARGGAGGLDGRTQTRRLNGAGPYRVVEFRSGARIRLERFAAYRRDGPKGGAAAPRITLRMIKDWGTQAAEVYAGGVHWTHGVPTEIAADVAASGAARFVSGPSMRVFYISLDAAGLAQPGGPLTRQLVRQALIYALDREALVRNLLGGSASVLHQACDPVQNGCETRAIRRYDYDPGRARRLLAQAGYPQGFDLELWTARDRPIAEAIVGQWQAVGVRARLRYVPQASLTEARRRHKIAAEVASSGSFGIPDVGALLPDRLGETDRNYSGDRKLTAQVVAAVSALDPTERRRRFAAILARIAEQAYWVPLYLEPQNYLIAPQVEFAPPRDGMPRLYELRRR